MSKSRHHLISIASAFAIGALGLLLWRLIDSPDEPSPETAEQKLTQPAKTVLDTAFRPAPASPKEDTNAKLRPDLAEMLKDTTPLARRMEILEEAVPELTEAEAMALIRELSSIPHQEENSSLHSTYIHKLCALLQNAGTARDDFANALATVAANRRLPMVYRDYAFQHLRILWRGSRDEATAAGQTRMQAIENTFHNLMDRQPETAAQSLLGLHESRETSGNPVVTDQEISRLSNAILDSPPAPNSIAARMTAVRVLGERRISGNSKMLRDIAASDAEHALVRSSAVGALGFIGAKSDLEFLETLATDDPVIAGALRYSAKRQ